MGDHRGKAKSERKRERKGRKSFRGSRKSPSNRQGLRKSRARGGKRLLGTRTGWIKESSRLEGEGGSAASGLPADVRTFGVKSNKKQPKKSADDLDMTGNRKEMPKKHSLSRTFGR